MSDVTSAPVPGAVWSASASVRRNRPTSVTMPMAWPEPRSASFVTTAGLMSTQMVRTQAGIMLPVAMECSMVESMITSEAPRAISA